jgi:hypothetical protein
VSRYPRGVFNYQRGCGVINLLIMWVGDWEGDEATIEQGVSQFQDIVDAGTHYWHRPIDRRRPVLDAFAILYSVSTNQHIRSLSFMVGSAENLGKHGFEAIKSIFSMPYWTRVWVIQEIILPSVATIVYGSISVPWKTVVAASTYWFSHTSTGCLAKLLELSSLFRQCLSDVVSAAWEISFAQTVLQPGANSELDLPRLLWNHVRRHATDPLDNAYALFGLVKNWPFAPLLPNYHRDWRELYQDLTLNIIEIEGNLECLCRESIHSDDLPSWVLNCKSIRLQIPFSFRFCFSSFPLFFFFSFYLGVYGHCGGWPSFV